MIIRQRKAVRNSSVVMSPSSFRPCKSQVQVSICRQLRQLAVVQPTETLPNVGGNTQPPCEGSALDLCLLASSDSDADFAVGGFGSGKHLISSSGFALNGEVCTR